MPTVLCKHCLQVFCCNRATEAHHQSGAGIQETEQRGGRSRRGSSQSEIPLSQVLCQRQVADALPNNILFNLYALLCAKVKTGLVNVKCIYFLRMSCTTQNYEHKTRQTEILQIF